MQILHLHELQLTPEAGEMRAAEENMNKIVKLPR